MQSVPRFTIGILRAVVFLCVGSCVSPCVSAQVPLKGPFQSPARPKVEAPPPVVVGPVEMVQIPGPLRSFLRMAGISQKVVPNEVLPLLARTVYMRGYQSGAPNEFLLLLNRYVGQARELQILAGSTGVIRVKNCDDAGTLVQILGYRLRQGCGQKNILLETANPERAFLTIDSGFPLADLEEDLQTGTPFQYAFASTRVPVLFHEIDWVSLSGSEGRPHNNQIDVLMNSPQISRLYWALSKTDEQTSVTLQRTLGLRRMLPFGPALDFYGAQISIRNGKVLTPGPASAEAAWKDLVGASPASPGDFVMRLVSVDDGWLAVYFDGLSRISPVQQAHFTEGARLKKLYQAFRSGDDKDSPTHGVFRKAPEFLVLTSRVQWDASGAPNIPGGVEVWKKIFDVRHGSKVAREWGKRARSFERPEQMLEGLTGMSSVEADSGALQIYLMASAIDAARTQGTSQGAEGLQPTAKLTAETVRLMAENFDQYSHWFLLFSEFPELDDASIGRFIRLANEVNGIHNATLRSNALGLFQANVGLWQILARQNEIPKAKLNASWQEVLDPFGKIGSSVQLFDAARLSVGGLVRGAGGSSVSQDEVVDLLAGPVQQDADGIRSRAEAGSRIRLVLSDQRLASLDALFALSDGFREPGRDAGRTTRMLELAAELKEFDMPKPILTNREKVSWAPTIYTAHHAELQIHTDLTKAIRGSANAAQVEAARGDLTPFLRDTLVGLNYAYYEPPGSQVLHHNPLFIRSHDFSGISVIGSSHVWGPGYLMGAGSPAGGAYLMGSLTGISYALASTEQDFIAPENVQALVWKEMAPDLMVSATLPRWWTVTPTELHAMALYQRFGDELLAAATVQGAGHTVAQTAPLREKVEAILSERMTPQRMDRIDHCLLHPDAASPLLLETLPADTFYLASEFRRRFPDEVSSWGASGKELEALARKSPAETDAARLGRTFGVPHPTLARTNARELLNVKPFPFVGGYSSHLFGESWESGNLYWARLADEMGYSPNALNGLIPELTHQMIGKIFATDIEDWPAVMRAMRETGDEFRKSKVAVVASEGPRQ
jgi:hypothetical protein